MFDELRQVEDILTEFQQRKKDLMFEINQRILKEDKVYYNLEALNAKIADIGGETLKMENIVKSICGDRRLLVPDEQEPMQFECIKVIFVDRHCLDILVQLNVWILKHHMVI